MIFDKQACEKSLGIYCESMEQTKECRNTAVCVEVSLQFAKSAAAAREGKLVRITSKNSSCVNTRDTRPRNSRAPGKPCA